ncbi:elongation factor P [Alphaproteobacteria bacterium]|nr:elongation factor P [Alphaproteobacteria bacterium]
MKIQANNIRPGIVIEYENRQWSVIKIQTTQPGKGGAYIQVEMKDLKTGNKTNARWRTQESVEKLITTEKNYQFLFSEEETYTFMDPDNYEQITLNESLIGEKKIYLKDGIIVSVNSVNDLPIGITLPPNLSLEVIQTEPVVKGQTAASSNKPAILDNGIRIMVPPFIDQGNKIIVNTSDNTYVKRAD